MDTPTFNLQSPAMFTAKVLMLMPYKHPQVLSSDVVVEPLAVGCLVGHFTQHEVGMQMLTLLVIAHVNGGEWW